MEGRALYSEKTEHIQQWEMAKVSSSKWYIEGHRKIRFIQRASQPWEQNVLQTWESSCCM
jgi:hypothetical protein